MKYDLFDYLDYHANIKFEDRKEQLLNRIKVSSINENDNIEILYNEFEDKKELIDGLVFYNSFSMDKVNDEDFIEINRVKFQQILFENFKDLEVKTKVEKIEDDELLKNNLELEKIVNCISDELYYKFLQNSLRRLNPDETQLEKLSQKAGKDIEEELTPESKIIFNKCSKQFTLLYELGVLKNLINKYPRLVKQGEIGNFFGKKVDDKKMGALISRICKSPTNHKKNYERLCRGANSFDKNKKHKPYLHEGNISLVNIFLKEIELK